jgi:nucleoside 2-deoxyribosyltransferase
VKIYLAGGMRSGWQDAVTDALAGHEIIDPRKKEKVGKWDLDKYGAWDLARIRTCDAVLGYMERTNPSGIGMAVEIGYAKGLGKTVVVVLEDNYSENETDKRHIMFMSVVADYVAEDIDDAISFFK